jgi:nascent polypeptide-associated complex subunit beta
VSGRGENKSLQELLPGIINQLGPGNLANLKKLAETMQGNENVPAADNDSDDDIPELVENFDDVTE